MTLSPSEICVLIPAYNEEKNIGRVIEEVSGLGFPVLAVDDGSTDGTAAAARNAGAELIVFARNAGKGAAIRRGLERAAGRPYRAVIIMDADGQHPAKELCYFVEALEDGGADVVVGDRMWDPKGMPALRRLTNRFMSWLISSAAGQRIPDTQCGFRALTRHALEKLSLRTDRFEIESEILMDAAKKKLRIRSIPVSSMYRGESSHIRPLQDAFRFIRFFVRFIFSDK